MTTPSLTIQILSLLGAMLCLIAYVAHQFHWMDARKFTYNICNAIGSGILATIAFHPFQAGFWLMESVWALVSLYALLKVFRRMRHEKHS